ncbi:MAG: hypothetical protein ACK4TA_10455, partial [Saprospiraceae bacterium]
MKKIYNFLFTVLLSLVALAAWANKVTLMGFDAKQNSFAFIVIADISGGSTISFENNVAAPLSASAHRGYLTYTVPAKGLSAGEIVWIDATKQQSSQGGKVALNGRFNIAQSTLLTLGSNQLTPFANCTDLEIELNEDVESCQVLVNFNNFNGSGFAPMPGAGQLCSGQIEVDGFSDG